ncbi:MAG: hypothetical protein ACE5DY_09145 [Mariprofundaceae bacterium]
MKVYVFIRGDLVGMRCPVAAEVTSEALVEQALALGGSLFLPVRANITVKQQTDGARIAAMVCVIGEESAEAIVAKYPS